MRITRHSIQRPPGDRRKGIALALAIALLASPVAMGVAPGDVTGLVSAQQQRGGPVQVVAQGIAKLPKGNLAWTVRRLDAPGDPGAPFAAFPVGFVLADGGTIALANEDGDVLELLGDGEAAFLPAGKGGAASSEDGEAAGLYEIALIAADQAATGQDVGTVAGTPFAPPKGDAFDLELMRASLDHGQEANVPAARSGAPVFFLQTNGVSELQTPDGQTAQLSAGQFALLQGDVLVRGASGESSSFVVAAIGDTAAKKAKAEGTPEARAGKNKGNKAGGGGGDGGGGGRGQAAGAAGAAGAASGVTAGQQKDKKNRGQGGGGGKNGGQSGGATGGGGTTAPQETGGTPVAEPTGPTAATPPVEAPQDAATPPAEATPPGGTTDETPATDEVTDDEVVVKEIVTDDETTTEDESPPDDVTPESTESEQPTDTESEDIPVGDTTDEIVIPVEETDAEAPAAETTVEEPAADAGAEAAPVEEPVVDTTIEEPVVEAPVEEAPAEQIVPVAETPAP